MEKLFRVRIKTWEQLEDECDFISEWGGGYLVFKDNDGGGESFEREMQKYCGKIIETHIDEDGKFVFDGWNFIDRMYDVIDQTYKDVGIIEIEKGARVEVSLDKIELDAFQLLFIAMDLVSRGLDGAQGVTADDAYTDECVYVIFDEENEELSSWEDIKNNKHAFDISDFDIDPHEKRIWGVPHIFLEEI